jgi:hypothetical protein
MFDRKFITNAIDRSSETGVDRRNFLAAAGIGVGAAVLAPAIGLTGSSSAEAASTGISDATILNFALNLEYLEAEFYLRAVTGQGLSDQQVTGQGTPGAVTGGRQVTFTTKAIRNYATEIAADEKTHVLFLRSALGGAAVSRPAIDIGASFTAAARAAGVVGPDQTFDPYADEVSFLIGAFIFEDLGVTAYKGAAPLIQNKTYLEAAAGILAVEAYHAGIVRSNLYALEQYDAVNKISAARDSLDGASKLDQGIGDADTANLVPTDPNGVAFSRSPGQVLNVAYLTSQAATSGGFYPAGINSDLLKSSAAQPQ